MSRKSLFEKVTFEQRDLNERRIGHMEIWGKSVPGRGNSQCKIRGVNMPELLEEQQAGQHDWSGVNKR